MNLVFKHLSQFLMLFFTPFSNSFTLCETKLKKSLLIALLLIGSTFLQRAAAQVAATKFNPDSADELTDTFASEKRIIPNDTFQFFKTRSDSLIHYSYTFLGNRYRRGGIGLKGFDCSGYTMTVFKGFGIKLPHTSAGQALMGFEVSRKNIRKGDLVFFRGRSRKGKRIGHVGIVISNKGEPVRFIHSSTSEGVRIDRLDFMYYKKRFIKATRLPELQ
ncbi:MAG: C40 family peptidase [Bacteroidia bacterium]